MKANASDVSHSCGDCGEPARLRCSACNSQWYCCKEHQITDWKMKHKFQCMYSKQSRGNSGYASMGWMGKSDGSPRLVSKNEPKSACASILPSSMIVEPKRSTAMHNCGYCGAAASIKCAMCNTIWYCCKEHQVSDWQQRHRCNCLHFQRLAKKDASDSASKQIPIIDHVLSIQYVNSFI